MAESIEELAKPQGSSLASMTQALLGAFSSFASRPTQVVPAPLPTEYPSDADAAYAREQGFGYGSGNEPFIAGERAREVGSPRGSTGDVMTFVEKMPVMNVAKERQPEISNDFTKAALVANRSPITLVGFDPAKTGLSPDKNMTIGGLYSRSKDVMYANKAGGPDNIVHEATHRGLQKLRRAGILSKEENEWLGGAGEEYLVRYLMQKYAGVKPPDKKVASADLKIGESQERGAQFMFFEGLLAKQNQRYAEGIERKAQDFIASQRPRGPK